MTTILAEGSIPSEYRPITNIHQNNRLDDELWLTSDGGILYYCNVALSNANIKAVMLYNY